MKRSTSSAKLASGRDAVDGSMRLADVYSAPGHLIRRSQQIALAIFFDEFRTWDVTPIQYAALVAIRDRPNMDQRTLVNTIAIDRSTIGSMLKVLEQRRMISRVTPKQNQRVKLLRILPAGENLLEATREAIGHVQERILAPLNLEEREIFLRYLARIVEINNELSRAPLRLANGDDPTDKAQAH